MIHNRATIGFESEWTDGVQPLIQGLCDRGLLSDSQLHRYHCDCHECTDLVGTMLRAQRDSTVQGELISGILPIGTLANESTTFTPNILNRLTTAIEEVAFDVDATPGINAGFHVHAKIRPHRMTNNINEYTGPMVGAVLMCMPVLTQIFGAGRHGDLGAMNQSSVANAHHCWRQYSSDDFPGLARLGRHLRTLGLGERTTNVDFHTYAGWFQQFVGADRHAHIAWVSRYNTVEFRFWRSTRMAWRMQLFCLLSALLVSPDFHTAVLERHGPRTTDLTLADPGWLYELLDGVTGVPSDLVPLMREQAQYVEWAANNPIPADYTSV